MDIILKVESLSNQEEVELRAKIETLGLEVRKLPSKSAQHMNEVIQLHLHPCIASHLLDSSFTKQRCFLQIDGDSKGVGQIICKA